MEHDQEVLSAQGVESTQGAGSVLPEGSASLRENALEMPKARESSPAAAKKSEVSGKKEKAGHGTLKLGIAMMLLSAVCGSTGQLVWKVAPDTGVPLLLYLVGVLLYGVGAVLMMTAFRYGEMSILHPMLSAGYVIGLFYGAVFLKEEITWQAVVGTLLIMIGMFFLGRSGKSEEGQS